jgi:hypothetical protein
MALAVRLEWWEWWGEGGAAALPPWEGEGRERRKKVEQEEKGERQIDGWH